MADEIRDEEAGRLAALDAYAILDTPAEAGFDDIVRIASQICGTPMAMISLVDDRRQWFKAAIGLDVAETPREIAFCAHAIKQPDVFEVRDAVADTRFHANPLVTGEPGLRFYAGAPLVTPEGHALGTLCVLDRTPRTLSPDQTGALAALARQVMAQLELRRALRGQRRDEEHRKLLVEELRHRSRNTLAVVQAIVAQSLRGVPGTAGARAAIGERLTSIANAHDLLAQSNWSTASIDEVVAAASGAVVGEPGRVVVAGPPVELTPRGALSLSMALHELGTNAVKHGALATETGSVSVDWTLADGRFELVWHERGGPPVDPPTRRGFGTQLVNDILPRELGGSARTDYHPDGVRWTLTTMLARIGAVPRG